MVKDTVDRMINLGLGLVMAGKDQIEKAVHDLVERGEVSRQESQALVATLIDKGEDTKLQLEQLVKERIDSILQQTSFATKDDIAQLEKRIAELERSASQQQ